MKEGTFVRVSYTGRIKETGRVFDTTDEETAREENAFSPQVNYGPVPVIVGEERVITGLDEVIREMDVGEEREVDIQPDDAFGERKSELIKLIPQQEFKKQGLTPQPGLEVTMNNVRGRVLSANSGRVRVDFNHPLAGKVLHYEVKVEEEITDDDAKAEAIAEFYAGTDIDIKRVNDEIEVEHEGEIPQKTRQAITNDLKKFLGAEKVKFSQTMKAEDDQDDENDS